jgi:predicted metalloprotease with PDZ domain
MRIDEGRLRARLAERAPGATVTVTLFRRDELLAVPVPLAAAPFDALTLVRVDQPDPLQERIYRGWLGLKAEQGSQRSLPPFETPLPTPQG